MTTRLAKVARALMAGAMMIGPALAGHRTWYGVGPLGRRRLN